LPCCHDSCDECAAKKVITARKANDQVKEKDRRRRRRKGERQLYAIS